MASYSRGGAPARHPGRPRRQDRAGRSSPHAARLNEATDENVRADLASLPGDLDRIDAWIADGRDGRRRAERAPTSRSPPACRLLMTFDDLRPCIEARPGGEMAHAGRPGLPGRRSAGLPAGVARAAAGYAGIARGPADALTRWPAERVQRLSQRGAVREAAAPDPAPAAARARSGGRSPPDGAASAARWRARCRRASSRSTSIGRGPWRGAAEVPAVPPPRSPCRGRAAPRARAPS